MITGKERFYHLVEEGRKGKNIGLKIGSNKLSLYMDDYLPGTSYLIGGSSGTGKSTFTLEKFIYNPLMDYLTDDSKKDRDPYWIMFSLEMTQEQVYAKLVSMYIFDKYGIQLRFKEIFSRGKDCRLSDEHYQILKDVDSFIDILDERLWFHEGSLTEEIYLKEMRKQLLRFGKMEDGIFYPNNPNQIVGALIDHCSLIKATNGRSKKDEMDAISRDSVMLRNSTRILSPIHVSQFNRSSNSDERLKQAMQDPNQSDFKDSGSLYEDSLIVIAVFSPHKYKLSTYRKYNIKELEQVFLAAFVLKSRFGTSDIAVPFGFYGDCSRYYELPKPDEIYDYEKYKTPDWVHSKEDSITEKEDNVNKQTFKFTL